MFNIQVRSPPLLWQFFWHFKHSNVSQWHYDSRVYYFVPRKHFVTHNKTAEAELGKYWILSIFYKPFLLPSLSFHIMTKHLNILTHTTICACVFVCVIVIKNVSTMCASVGTISRVSELNNWPALLRVTCYQHSVRCSVLTSSHFTASSSWPTDHWPSLHFILTLRCTAGNTESWTERNISNSQQQHHHHVAVVTSVCWHHYQ